MYSLTCLPFGGRMESCTGLPCQTLAAVRQHAVVIISDLHWYAKRASVSKSQSTPSGCCRPNPMHNLTTLSYCKKLGFNRVPLPQVATNMQILFPISMSLHRVRSISSEAVAVDEVDMLVREGNQMGQSMPGKIGSEM